MAGQGKRPLPIETHKKRGTYRKDRHGTSYLSPEIPDPPPGITLSEDEQAVWEYISRSLLDARLLSHLDGMSLYLLVTVYCRLIRANQLIEENGGEIIHQVNKGGDIYITKNPAVTMRDKAWDQLLKVCRDFGLSPSARTGMEVSSKPKSKSEISEILGLN